MWPCSTPPSLQITLVRLSQYDPLTRYGNRTTNDDCSTSVSVVGNNRKRNDDLRNYDISAAPPSALSTTIQEPTDGCDKPNSEEKVKRRCVTFEETVRELLNHNGVYRPRGGENVSVLKSSSSSETRASFHTILNRSLKRRSKDSKNEDVVAQSLLKYINLHDRYCALASLLLKSKAYHELIHEWHLSANTEHTFDSLCTANRNEKHKLLPIVELPRTVYGKPFIPDFRPKSSAENNADDYKEKAITKLMMISVSHQYPYTALVRWTWTRNNSYEEKRDATTGSGSDAAYCLSDTKEDRGIQSHDDGDDGGFSSTMSIGLDIVAPDRSKLEMSSSRIREYLQCFALSFTDFEWNSIMYGSYLAESSSLSSCCDCNTSQAMLLKEFYIRWGMKEAYTKAIGYGVGLEFSSFEILPVEILKNDYRDDGLNDLAKNYSWWSHIKLDWQQCQYRNTANEGDDAATSESKPVIHRMARIRHIKTNIRVACISNNDDGISSLEELWHFWFISLDKQRQDSCMHKKNNFDDDHMGWAVACICMGPNDVEKALLMRRLYDKQNYPNVDCKQDENYMNGQLFVDLKEMDLNDLIDWHNLRTSVL